MDQVRQAMERVREDARLEELAVMDLVDRMHGQEAAAAEETALYKLALDIHGKSKQVDMALEEMSELAKALLNERRGRGENIVEELADVSIMLKQMLLIFDPDGSQFMEIKSRKLTRLRARLQERLRAAEGRD
ncbi:hypothetical protein SIID45300_02407 [Candidatus Magnetaquicoccaceae bacterium FCR-1]|uniref:Uncharacterized protein n=2 Tax=Candidatus Magnetaquiglobus chichijimensis TaxID=3141448 RepID=A0ABQ0CAZ1_9PROT